MEHIYFWVFAAICMAMITGGIITPLRCFEFPFFIASIFATFLIPQAVALLRNPSTVPALGFEWAMLMAVLCVAMSWIGYRLPHLELRWLRNVSTDINPTRFLLVGILYLVIALVFTRLIDALPDEDRDNSMWTGTITIYAFFTGLNLPALGVFVYLALRYYSKVAILGVVLSAIPPVQAMIFAGRREQSALFLLTLGLTYCFVKRRVPNRAFLVGALVFAMVAIPLTEQYRSFISSRGNINVEEHRFEATDTYASMMSGETNLELRNAAVVILSTWYHGDYQFGTAYWDRLVFRYVPAQIVGPGAKQALMFNKSDVLMNIEIPTGTTITGLADSFQQLGFFGCIFFAVLAWLFKNLWAAVQQTQNPVLLLLYVQSIPSAMRAVTHWTVDFLPGFVFNLLFIGCIYFFVRVRTQNYRLRPAQIVRPMAFPGVFR